MERVAGSVTRPKNTFTNLRHVKSGVSSMFSWSRRLFDGCFCRVATTLHVHRAPMLCWLATSSPPARLRPRAHVPIRTTERLMLQWVRETKNTGTWGMHTCCYASPGRWLVSSLSRKLQKKHNLCDALPTLPPCTSNFFFEKAGDLEICPQVSLSELRIRTLLRSRLGTDPTTPCTWADHR